LSRKDLSPNNEIAYIDKIGRESVLRQFKNAEKFDSPTGEQEDHYQIKNIKKQLPIMTTVRKGNLFRNYPNSLTSKIDRSRIECKSD